MGLDFSHDFGVGDFFKTIGGDVLVVDDEEGFSAFDARACIRGINANNLTQAA